MYRLLKREKSSVLPTQCILCPLCGFDSNCTYCMEQSPFLEGNKSSVSQKISLILWNPKAYIVFTRASHLYLTCGILLNSLESYFLKVRFNIIHPSASRSSKWAVSLCLRFPHQNLVCTSPLLIAFHMPHPLFI